MLPSQKSNPDAILLSLLFVSLFNLLLVRLLLYITVGVLLQDIAVSSTRTLECPSPGHWSVSQEDTGVSFCRTLGSDDIFSIFDFPGGKFNL